MFGISEYLREKAVQAAKKAIETGAEEVAVESGFFVTTNKNQLAGVGFFDQFEESGKTFYICQKLL